MIFPLSVEHVHAMYPKLKPYLPEEFPEDYRAYLETLMALPEKPVIPARIYLDGFCAQDWDVDAYQNDVIPASMQGVLVLLNEANCDLASAPDCIRQAHAAKDHAEVAAWFALKRIQEEGGIYAAPGAHLLPATASLRFDQAFFCAGRDQTVSLHFFGGAAGNVWMKRLLESLRPNDTLTERLAAILLTQGGVHLLGEEERGIDQLHILSDAQSKLNNKKSCCFLNGSISGERTVVLPADVYKAMMQDIADLQGVNHSQEIAIHKLERRRQSLFNQRNSCRQQRDALHDQMEALKLRLHERKTVPLPKRLLRRIKSFLHK